VIKTDIHQKTHPLIAGSSISTTTTTTNTTSGFPQGSELSWCGMKVTAIESNVFPHYRTTDTALLYPTITFPHRILTMIQWWCLIEYKRRATTIGEVGDGGKMRAQVQSLVFEGVVLVPVDT